MKHAQTTPLETLKKELEFVDDAGYKKPVGSRQALFCMETGATWRKPVFIEDSPTCPKEKYCPCNPEGDCVLLGFVPAEHKHETLPCHHIPLNEKGETIAGLEKDRDKVEPALRDWLVKTIGKLEGTENKH
jgi:hypothetical protein